MYATCLRLLERENRGKPYPEQTDVAGRNVEFIPVDSNGKPLPNGEGFSGEVVVVFQGPRENNAIDVHITTTGYSHRAPRVDTYIRLYPWGYAEIRLPDLQRPLSESCTYSRPDQFLREPNSADIVFWNNVTTPLAA